MRLEPQWKTPGALRFGRHGDAALWLLTAERLLMCGARQPARRVDPVGCISIHTARTGVWPTHRFKLQPANHLLFAPRFINTLAASVTNYSLFSCIFLLQQH